MERILPYCSNLLHRYCSIVNDGSNSAVDMARTQGVVRTQEGIDDGDTIATHCSDHRGAGCFLSEDAYQEGLSDSLLSLPTAVRQRQPHTYHRGDDKAGQPRRRKSRQGHHSMGVSGALPRTGCSRRPGKSSRCRAKLWVAADHPQREGTVSPCA